MLLINRFIGLIEDHAESLSLTWVDEVRSNTLTSGYSKYSRKELHDIVYSRFRRLGKWVAKRENIDKEIALNFREMGKERAEAGIKSSEMIYSIILERDMLFAYVKEHGIVTEGIDLNRAIQFSEQLNYFYDKAIYFALVGYEQVLCVCPTSGDENEFNKTLEGFKHWLIRE
ncbi:MAG: hypothetical protein ISR54_08800 [Chlorobium phaeobacteroides]|uniref:RsbT co-antagonist protein RsbRD N-terminal domain-containing protein n=1 Tax=Chlorobium phaeobacteroides (strain BS1) TaxID=331678 RepID=B3EPN3_CHLPB|nr:hypothetical protein [Chlorobium phaeobacteroides]MBL6956893.1 hypothetical protein [Chlorobium phaeobacteroides]